MPQTKTFREMGLDLPESGGDTMSTDIGPISGGIAPYLHFLRAVRICIEAHSPTRIRAEGLHALLAQEEFKDFVNRHGGPETISNRFFPFFVDTIPSLPESTVSELRHKGLTTPATLSGASDEELLAIKGIGAAKLKALRAHCVKYSGNLNEERLDLVR